MPQPESEAVHRSITIDTDTALTWHAWTSAARVTQWFAPEAVIEPVVGGKYELYFIPGNTESMNTRGCRVTQVEDRHLLEFTWRAPDNFAGLMNDAASLTTVAVRFSAVGDLAVVDVEHHGFGSGPAWDAARAWHEAAWSQALASLKNALESGNGTLCCSPEEATTAAGRR